MIKKCVYMVKIPNIYVNITTLIRNYLSLNSALLAAVMWPHVELDHNVREIEIESKETEAKFRQGNSWTLWYIHTERFLMNKLTPFVWFDNSPMIDLAYAFCPICWGEVGTLRQMKVPVLFEGQVSLLGIGKRLSITLEIDGDVRGVEVAHMADQGVLLSKLSRVPAVDLDLGWTWGQHREKVNQNKLVIVQGYGRC